jgi:uncharacterized protein
MDFDDTSISIREIELLLDWMNNQNQILCAGDSSCLQWISIDPNGDLYPCEYLRTDVAYGNILEMDLSEIRATTQYKHFIRMFLGNVPEECKQCEYYKLCGNGCPANRVKNNLVAFDGKYVYCKQKIQLYNELASVLA